MGKKETGLIFLYNALYAISSKYKELEHLESSVFEVMDEIDSCILTGFNDQAFSNYSKSGMDEELVNELEKFGEFVSKIKNEYWNSYDFDKSEDWQLARKWANSLLNKLGMSRNGWNSGNTKLIYLKKN